MLDNELTALPGDDEVPTTIERRLRVIDLKILSPRRGPSNSELVSFLNSRLASLYMDTKAIMLPFASETSRSTDTVAVPSVTDVKLRLTPSMISEIWLVERVKSTPFTVRLAFDADWIDWILSPEKSDETEKALFKNNVAVFEPDRTEMLQLFSFSLDVDFNFLLLEVNAFLHLQI